MRLHDGRAVETADKAARFVPLGTGAAAAISALQIKPEGKTAVALPTVNKIVGTDLGYDSKPHFSYDEFFHRPGTLWRHRYFMHKTDTSRSEG